jgi:hypothetical protein
MQEASRPFLPAALSGHGHHRPDEADEVVPMTDILVLLIGAAAGGTVAWRTAKSRARAELRRHLTRASAEMAREVTYWKEAAERANVEAARVAFEADAYKAGQKHGREDVMSIMPLLVATQHLPEQRPATERPGDHPAGGDSDCG